MEVDKRANGRDWPNIAETMIGTARMNNLQACLEDVLQRGVDGDVIEAGVWRGGASIFMRGILAAYGSSKHVYVADSFRGLPSPNAAKYPADKDMDLHTMGYSLVCPQKTVQANFARYDLFDDQVHFVVGWFKDTLPRFNQHKWSLVRLDGDMYESTMQSLEFLYPQLQPGGYLIQDDYGGLEQARRAIDDYRAKMNVTAPIQKIDWTGAFWQKES